MRTSRRLAGARYRAAMAVIVPIYFSAAELPRLADETRAWVAGNTGLVAFIALFVVGLFFAILYFASGGLAHVRQAPGDGAHPLEPQVQRRQSPASVSPRARGSIGPSKLRSKTMPPRAYLKLLALSIAGIVAAGALTFAALVIRLAIVDPFGGPQHPSDGALLTQFAAQRPALEELVGMLGDDPGIERLAADFTRPDPLAAAPERIADYRARLAAAGIARGLARHGDTATFIVSTRGLAISGSAKAFVHAPKADADATVVNGDLDAAAAALPNVLLQRPIGEGWWLQLDMR